MKYSLSLRACVVAIAVTLSTGVACQKPEEARPERPAEPVATPPPKPAWNPPPARVAIPNKIMAMRVKGQRAGAITFKGGEPLVLNALGLNSCQNGWVLQGYYTDAEGRISSTQAIALELANVPLHPFVHESELMAGARVSVDFSRFSESHVTGRIAVLDPAGESIVSLDVDTEPTNVAAGKELGQNGCFATGEYRINGELHGPTHGVWDGKNLYLARLRFDEEHEMEVALEMQPFQRRPENVFVGDLAKLLEDPIGAPARFVFTTLEDRESPTENGMVGPVYERKRIPALKGSARARFASTDARGPLRWKLEKVQVPEWSGPFSGQTLDVVDIEVQFPNPKLGVIPAPQPPTWLQN